MTNNRKSVETNSLRLRPVCNFQPSGPSSSTRAFSTKWWTSSAVAPNDSSHAESVFARSEILSSAESVCFTSAPVKTPTGCNALAQARSTAISYGRRRRSNAKERWNASNCLFGSRSKRPPHSRSSLRSVILYSWDRHSCLFRFSSPVKYRGQTRMSLLLISFSLCFGTHGYGQRKQIDKTFGVLGVVPAHGEAGQIGAVKRERRNTLGDVERAFPQFQADGAGDALLRNTEKSIERFAERRKPQAVVDKFRVAQRERLLEMRGFAVDGEALELLMRFDEQRSAGSLIGAARFHPDKAILDEIGAAYPVLRGNFIQRVEQFDGPKFRVIHGNRCAGFKSDFDFFGLGRSFFRGNDPLPHRFVGRVRRIFEFAAFVAEMPNVSVSAVNVFLALLDRNVVFLRIGDGVFTGIDVPLAPRRDDLNIRRDGLVGQFETHLVVAFSSAAVGKAVGAKLQRDFRLALGDDGARHGSAEQVCMLVNCAGAKRRPNVIAHKFFAQIFDVRGRSARSKRFLARSFEVFLLADVADHGDHFAAVVFLEPGNDDGRIQAAGIGEYNFFRFRQLCFHDSSLASWCCCNWAPTAVC